MKKTFIISLCCAAFTLGAGAQRIAVLSDLHVIPGNENDRQLRLAVEEINHGEFDYVVVNGDISNEGSDEQLLNVKEILDGISKPLAVLPGNHENNWSQSATKTFNRQESMAKVRKVVCSCSMGYAFFMTGDYWGGRLSIH